MGLLRLSSWLFRVVPFGGWIGQCCRRLKRRLWPTQANAALLPAHHGHETTMDGSISDDWDEWHDMEGGRSPPQLLPARDAPSEQSHRQHSAVVVDVGTHAHTHAPLRTPYAGGLGPAADHASPVAIAAQGQLPQSFVAPGQPQTHTQQPQIVPPQQQQQIQQPPEPEEDFFQDMTPVYRRPKLVVVGKDAEPSATSTSSRLSVNTGKMEAELGAWDDDEATWEAELDGATAGERADAERKRAERRQRRVEREAGVQKQQRERDAGGKLGARKIT
eukprot:Opistho-2@9788